MKYENIHWLEDEEYLKARGRLKLQYLTLLGRQYPMYGYVELHPGTAEIATKLAEDYGLVVRGIQKPILLELIDKRIF